MVPVQGQNGSVIRNVHLSSGPFKWSVLCIYIYISLSGKGVLTFPFFFNWSIQYCCLFLYKTFFSCFKFFWLLLFCAVVSVYSSLAVEDKWWTTSSVSWWGSTRLLNIFLTCLLLLYTMYISIQAMYCCYCWLYPCTPCFPLQNNHVLWLLLTAPM